MSLLNQLFSLFSSSSPSGVRRPVLSKVEPPVLSKVEGVEPPAVSRVEPPVASRVEPAEAARLVHENKAVLVDVREPGEWAGGVAQNAALLSFSDLTGLRQQWQPFLDQLGEREIILYCRSGARSGRAARMLSAEGFKTANAGGFGDWRAAGLPVCIPKGLR
jgi:rhodanese-related sulfurtransferase